MVPLGFVLYIYVTCKFVQLAGTGNIAESLEGLHLVDDPVGHGPEQDVRQKGNCRLPAAQ